QEPAAASKGAAVATAPSGSTDPVTLGLRLGPISKEARVKYKLAASVSGVLVEEVTPNSAGAGRGLAAGNVILKLRDTRVATVDQVAKGLVAASAAGHRNAVLLVQKKDRQHWVTVPLGTGR